MSHREEMKWQVVEPITTEVSRYRGRIWQWDVVNEMLTDSNPSQINPTECSGKGSMGDRVHQQGHARRR